jgi:hypothetical protein
VATKHSNLGALLKLWAKANEKLTTEELRKKMFLATDCWEQPFWDMVGNREGENLLLQIWDFAKKNLTTDMLKDLLFVDRRYEKHHVAQCSRVQRNIVWLRVAEFRETSCGSG